jgi:hypothetical protein
LGSTSERNRSPFSEWRFGSGYGSFAFSDVKPVWVDIGTILNIFDRAVQVLEDAISLLLHLLM